MNSHFVPIEADRVYKLLNIGATALVSACYEDNADVMPAAWACALDLVPCKATVVIDKSHFTRHLVEKSGYFALMLPTRAIAKETLYLGSVSKHDDKEKLEKSGAEFFKVDGFDMPLVKDCAAWMIFKVLPEPHNEKTYDLFIGECVAAWADDRIYRDGRWLFEKADKSMSTLHYVAGGHFYTMGEPIDVEL